MADDNYTMRDCLDAMRTRASDVKETWANLAMFLEGLANSQGIDLDEPLDLDHDTEI